MRSWRSVLAVLLITFVALAGCASEEPGSAQPAASDESGPQSEMEDEPSSGGQATNSGRSSGGDDSPPGEVTQPGPTAQKINDSNQPATPAADGKPQVIITPSVQTAVAPVVVELKIRAIDPDGDSMELHYDLGLGAGTEGNSGQVTIDGSGTLTLGVEYSTPGTYTVKATAKDGDHSIHESQPIQALTGCSQGHLTLTDDDNQDGDDAGRDGTCLSARPTEDELIFTMGFRYGSNVTDPNDLPKLAAEIQYKATFGDDTRNRFTVSWSPSIEAYVVHWEYKEPILPSWHTVPPNDLRLEVGSDYVLIGIPIDEIEGGNRGPETNDTLEGIQAELGGTDVIDYLPPEDEAVAIKFTEDDIILVDQ